MKKISLILVFIYFISSNLVYASDRFDVTVDNIRFDEKNAYINIKTSKVNYTPTMFDGSYTYINTYIEIKDSNNNVVENKVNSDTVSIKDFKERVSLFVFDKLTPGSKYTIDAFIKRTDKGVVDNSLGKMATLNPTQEFTFTPQNKPTIIETKKTVSENSSIYNFLAPIAGIKCMDSNNLGGINSEGCIGNNIGDYLNIIFKLAIGICAALAVIMLIINGITYMGDESIFSKTEAKSKMTSAIFGLLIALAAWALLNTINPALTGKDGVAIDQASLEVETQPLTTNDPLVEGAKTNDCPEGIITAVTVKGGIPVCSRLKNKIVTMIATANAAGINLFGFGYRSVAKQEELRAKNCGGSAFIYDVKAKCSPLTAVPGKSRHQNGLAVDFTCNGSTIKSRDNACFVWLTANAPTEYKNLKAEPWHWSTDGN